MSRLFLVALCIAVVLAGPVNTICSSDSDYLGPAIGDFCPAGADNQKGNCCMQRPKTTCPTGFTSIGAAIGERCPAGAQLMDGACCK